MAALTEIGEGKQRKKRDCNFSNAELRVLLDFIKEHHFVLFDTLQGTAVTAKKKAKLCEIITPSVNVCEATRTVKQVKKKSFD